MNDKVDTQQLLANTATSDIISRYIELEKSGNEYQACCPFHSEKTPSFKINDVKGFYYCFGCGTSGDAIDFVQKIRGVGFREACSEIQGCTVSTEKKTPTKKNNNKKKNNEIWTPILPVPDSISIPRKIFHPKHGEPSKIWYYRNTDGNLLGLVCRFDMPDNKKDICPYVFAANCVSRKWKWMSFPKPRPLYGLEKLAGGWNSVIVVEGEKAADAAQILFPTIPVLSWPGGGKAVKYADWSVLTGKKVVIWPDRDQPGIDTAMDLATILVGDFGVSVRIVELPPGPADGWDAADALADGATDDTAIKWLKSNLRDPQDYLDIPAPWSVPDEPVSEQKNYIDHDAGFEEPEEPIVKNNRQFICLGHDHGMYYYWNSGGQQVLAFNGPGHSSGNLLTLAPLQYWEREYPGRGGANWQMAANGLIRQSYAAGIYDESRVRGRGAWWDGDKPVLHMGDKLVVDNKFKALDDIPGKYIYEAAYPLPINLDDPLPSTESIKLLDFCRMLSWERPISATLFAGWCVVAPICGALMWRPHIWITGSAGAGKSWIFDNVLKRCLGDIALQVQSETTEAGLRQALGQDARPIIFDEAEGEDVRAQQRIQNIMALMRQSSSESGASIVKGSANGSSKQYKIRSCFAFESIGVGLHQHADKTRVTILSLYSNLGISGEEKVARFESIKKTWAETLTESFVLRLHARVVRLIPQIRRNAEIFAVAATKTMGTRRLGDQIGALLAGAYALHSTKEISLDEAEAWISKQDWTEETAVHENNEEESCVRYILESKLMVYADNNNTYELPISELIQICDDTISPYATNVCPKSDAEDTLRRNGIRMDLNLHSRRFIVSNSHSSIAKILRGTPWAKNWSRMLRRIENAEATHPMRFGSGIQSRGISLPTDIAIGD